MNWKTELAVAALALLAWTSVTAGLVRGRPEIEDSSFLRAFLRFKKVLFTVFGGILIGVCGNAVWEWIKSLK